jgi:hypothetical protein
MNPLLKKLNFKEHKSMVVLNAPHDLDAMWEEFKTHIDVKKSLGETKVDFALIFCTKLDEVIKFGIMVFSGLFIPKAAPRNINASLIEIMVGNQWVAWATNP